jgi:hypothetical protein
MANDGYETEGVSNVNAAGNRAYSNIQNMDMMIQRQDEDQSRVPYVYNGTWYPGVPNGYNQGVYSNIQNTNMMIHGQPQDQDQGQVLYAYNGTWHPGVPNGYNQVAYSNIQNMNIMIQGRDEDQGQVPYVNNGTWYPSTPNNMLHAQTDYTYPNPPPAMDMNMNRHNSGHYFNEPATPFDSYVYYDDNTSNYIYADGVYQLQQQPQDGFYQFQQQLQPQVRSLQLFDSGWISSRHYSGRNSNTLQAGRGRGNRGGLRDNNYTTTTTSTNNNNTSLSQVMDNIEELLMRLRISEGERSTQLQGEGEGHAEPQGHSNADAAAGFSREYSNAKFFVIKSYSRENVVSSIKHGVWTSTRKGNRALNAAYYGEARHEQSANASSPVFLFFSVIL